MSDRLCTIRAGALPASCVLPILMESSQARGESKNWCVYRCVCSEGTGSVVPVRRGWVQGDLGAPIPIPGEREPRCNRSWGAAGWEPSMGLGHYRMPGSSGIVGCSSVSISTPGTAHPAPASVSPSLSMSLLHGTVRPLLHTPSFWRTTVASQRGG